MQTERYDEIFTSWTTRHREMVNRKKRMIIAVPRSNSIESSLVTLRSTTKLNLELLEQQKHGLNTDIVLKCKDGFFSIHSCILMICSPLFFKFRQQFDGSSMSGDHEYSTPPRLSDADLSRFTLRDVATVLFLFYTGETMINMPGMLAGANPSECQRKTVVDILEQLGAIPAEVLVGFPLGYDENLVERQLMNFNYLRLRFGVDSVHPPPGKDSSVNYYLISVDGIVESIPNLPWLCSGSSSEGKNPTSVENDSPDVVMEASAFRIGSNKDLPDEAVERPPQNPAISSTSKEDSRFGNLKLGFKPSPQIADAFQSEGAEPTSEPFPQETPPGHEENDDTVSELHVATTSKYFSQNHFQRELLPRKELVFISHSDGRSTEVTVSDSSLHISSSSKSRPGDLPGDSVLPATARRNKITAAAATTKRPLHRKSGVTTIKTTVRSVCLEIPGSSKRPMRVTALQAQASISNIIDVFPDKPPKKYRRRSVRRNNFSSN